MIVYGGLAIVAAGFVWIITAPSSDQVCRNREAPLFDWIHGTDAQPTCQQLINQIEAQAVGAERKAAELEDRG